MDKKQKLVALSKYDHSTIYQAVKALDISFNEMSSWIDDETNVDLLYDCIITKETSNIVDTLRQAQFISINDIMYTVEDVNDMMVHCCLLDNTLMDRQFFICDLIPNVDTIKYFKLVEFT